MTAVEHAHHRAGLALVAMAALAWSSAGIFTRLISADLMTLLFWRGLASGTAVILLFLFMEGGRVPAIIRSLGWPSLAVTALSALSMLSGIGSFRFGSVADSMVIYAMVPFITAGLAYLFIGEKPSRSTIIASAVALTGVIVMLMGARFDGSMWGRGMAVLMSTSMAGFTVVMRQHREVPMLPAMGASAWLCAFICFWFADPLHVDGRDFILMILFGVMQNALGLALYVFGSRRVPAAEATLIAALEVPFTPFWVWLLIGEIPSNATLFGGSMVLAALFGHIAGELRKGRPREAVVPAQP